jgi:hypothetical protein
MNKRDFIKIINEEVSDFDFLGNDERLKYEEVTNLLRNEEFQKQFICDSLLKNNKIKIGIYDSKLTGNWEDTSENSKFNLDYYLNIEYKYDQNVDAVKFQLIFDGENISMSKGGGFYPGNRETAPESTEFIDGINWHDINVMLSTTDGDEIKFTTFEKAPPKIQVLFIRQYVESFIGDQSNLDVRTPEGNDNVKNTPYC